jgi:hypothetical protein
MSDALQKWVAIPLLAAPRLVYLIMWGCVLQINAIGEKKILMV